jgi:hypothetical protein
LDEALVALYACTTALADLDPVEEIAAGVKRLGNSRIVFLVCSRLTAAVCTHASATSTATG